MRESTICIKKESNDEIIHKAEQKKTHIKILRDSIVNGAEEKGFNCVVNLNVRARR